MRVSARSVVLLTFFLLTSQVNASEASLIGNIIQKVINFFYGSEGDVIQVNLKVVDIGYDWVHLTCDDLAGYLVCNNESISMNSCGMNIRLPKPGITYNCSVINDNKSISNNSVTFTLGAGNVTSVPELKVIAQFTDERESSTLNCTVMNGGVQTDTLWSIENYGGVRTLQRITDNEIFQISGEKRQICSEESECNLNYGNDLTIISVEQLNDTIIHCGSHLNCSQTSVEIVLCDLPKVMREKEIHLWEGQKNCSINIINFMPSYLVIKNPSLKKKESETRSGIYIDRFDVNFDVVRREDAGNYSAKYTIPCREDSAGRIFEGDFTLDVLFGPIMDKREGEFPYSIPWGEKLELVCGENLESNPQAKVTWTRPDGKTVTDSGEEYSVISGPEKVGLTVLNVSKTDNGTWNCTVDVSSDEGYRSCHYQNKLLRRIERSVQVIVVVPPSEPRNVRVEEINSSAVHIRWDEPDDPGSPYVTGYKLCYNDTCIQKQETNATVGVDVILDNGKLYNIRVSAISGSNNVTKEGPCDTLMFVMDYPQDLKVLDIGSTWAYLSWKELFVFCGPSPPTYEITCDSREKAFKFTTMETSYNITDLSTNIIYNCTVFAISDNQRCSLNSPPTQFLPGAGNVTVVPDLKVIARFTDESESTALSCTVLNRVVQTDTVWSVENYNGARTLERITDKEIFQISGERRQSCSEESECNLNYGNYLTIVSVEQLNDTTIHCGSHLNRSQTSVKVLISDLPKVMRGEEISLWEGQKDCSVNIINLMPPYLAIKSSLLKKNESETRPGIYIDRFDVNFDVVRREDVGIYSANYTIPCHEGSAGRIFEGDFTLDVLFGPIMDELEGEFTYYIPLGDEAELVCGKNLESNPQAKVTWTRPDGITVTDSGEEYSVISGPEKVGLSIMNVRKTDNGTWRCTVDVSSDEGYENCHDPTKLIRRVERSIQVIVVVPPSEPLNVRVEEINFSAVHIRWDEPDDPGSPYVTGYKLCYNDMCIQKQETNATVGVDVILDDGKLYNIRVSAISGSNNVTKEGPCDTHVFVMDHPPSFIYAEVGSTWASLSWHELPVSCQSSGQKFNLTCTGHTVPPISIITKYTKEDIHKLTPSTTYYCTVVAIYGNKACSLQSSLSLSTNAESHTESGSYMRAYVSSATFIGIISFMYMYMTCQRAPAKNRKPCKPKVTRIFHDSVELGWVPHESDALKNTSYAVYYRSEHDYPGQWNRQDTIYTNIIVKGLSANTTYTFKVCALDKGKNTIIGLESEISDPVTTTNAPLTTEYAPSKPCTSQVTNNSVTLSWGKHQDRTACGEDFTILYRPLDERSREYWKELRVYTKLNSAVIDGLKPETRYVFKVRSESGEKCAESDVSDPVLTSTSAENELQVIKTPAESLRRHSPLIYTGHSHPDIYCPISARMEGEIQTCTVTSRVDPHESDSEIETSMNERVLMLVGATGAGKSSLINGISNYIMGVRWSDTFRFKVVTDENRASQAHSQTSKITVYSFQGSKLPYTLRVIDTPGFGDTRGINRDRSIVEQIKSLFSQGTSNSIDQIHGIGFVMQASAARLTPTQKYIFDSVLAVFGRDIISNIFILITFADNQEPPVLSAIKEAEIPYQRNFSFNNSALYANHADNGINEMFWNLGEKNFDLFFTELEKVEARSLQLTRETLNERQRLEAVIESLKLQIQVGLSKMNVLRQKQRILRKQEAEILQKKHFTYELTVTKQRQINLPDNVGVTNCLQCNFTCHYPCPIAKDEEKHRCKAMDGRGPDSTCCTVCPGNCPWSQHINAPYRYELYYEVETHTSDDLKMSLSEAIEGKNQIEAMIADIEQELDLLQGTIVGMVGEAKRSLERLQKIALKPNPLSETEYIDLLIKAEKSEKSPGYTERIKAFEIIKTIVKQQGAVSDASKTDSTWWKMVMEK